MKIQNKFSWMIAVWVVLALMLAACGTADEPEVAELPAPVEEVVDEPVVAPEVEEVEEAVEPEVDLRAEIHAYLSALPQGFYSVNLEALQEMIATGNVLLVDVREAGEYADGHIPDAINIPLRTLAQNLDKISTDQPVVLYCSVGHRCAMGASVMHLLGYMNVRSFPASYGGWTEAGLPVSTDPVEVETFALPELNPQLLAAADEFLTTIPEGWLAYPTVERLKEVMEAGNVLLVDVREPGEFADGHIPGATNIPIRTLVENLDQISTDQPVVVYCASGLRCGMVTPLLHMLSYTNVRSFPPSFRGWQAAGETIAQ